MPAKALREPPVRAARLVPGPVFEAGQRADALIADAQREAERIRIEAADSAHRLAGEEVARLIGLLERTRAELHQQVEPELIELATALAERILHRELELNPAVTAELVAAALLKARNDPVLAVHVHSDDMDSAAKFQAELAAIAGDDQPLRIEADDSVPRHGCRVKTAAGTIDGTIEGQLALLAEAMRRKSESS